MMFSLVQFFHSDKTASKDFQVHVMKLKKTWLRAGGAGAVYPHNLKKMAQRNAIIGFGKRGNKPSLFHSSA